MSSKQLKTTHAPTSSYFTPVKGKPRESLFPVRSEIKESFKLQRNSDAFGHKTKLSSNFLLSQNRYLNTDSAMDLKGSQAMLN